MRAIGRLLRLQPEEVGLVLVLGLLLMGNSIALQVSGIVAISGFLSNGGVNQFLLVVLIDWIFILVMSGLQTLIIDRFNRTLIVGGIGIALLLVFIVLRIMFAVGAPNWLSYGVMYLISEQQFFAFPLIFWVLANDVFNMEQSKRLFPLISSGSFIGELIGIGIAAAFPAIATLIRVKPEDILFFNALIYLGIFLLVTFGLRGVHIRKTVQQRETVRETLNEGWGFVKEVMSFRYLMFSILALSLCSIIIEFRFWVTTNAAYPNQIGYLQFYSLYRLCLTIACFGVQTFLTSRITTSIGLKNVFFILPVITLAGAIGILFMPGVPMAVVALLSFMLIRLTIHEAAVKSFESLVPEERRGRVSMFMDGYLPAIGIILGCLIAGAVVLIGLWQQVDLYLVYIAIIVGVAVLSIFAILKMRQVYDSSLLNWRLKRRQRGSSRVLDKLDFEA